MTHLVLHSVGKTFGGLQAVSDLSLDVLGGRITGLIGPNGAGKTTVVNLITGMLKATSGQIRLDDRDITWLPPHKVARAGIARTFQNIRLLADASVLDNVVAGFHTSEKTTFAANLLGLVSARRERDDLRHQAYALLERLAIADLADYPAGQLSYGHQRRVEIARALATHPTVLLLDEPVAGMNDVEGWQLENVFRELARSGLAILLIEHNMRFVMAVCEHIYAVNSGSLIASGSPDAIAADPAVIEAYLGSG